MKLTSTQRERYGRMLALYDFDDDDLGTLMKTTVSVVGAGGLGSPALRLFTALGFGTIRIIDRDVVELTNLQRQTVYNTSDIDKPKAEAAAYNLRLMNPEVKFEPICVSLDNSNAQDILKGSNVIVDGLDSFLTRHAVNRASVALKIPYIYAGAIEYQSNLSTFVPGESGCLYCLAGNAKDDPTRTCANVGVSPDLLHITASIEVREALLIALGRQPLLKDRVMTIDITSLTFDFFDVSRMENCPVCSISPTKYPIESEGPSVTVLCSGAFSIAPPKQMNVDTDAIFEHLEKTYRVKKIGKALQIKTSTEAQITLMTSGIAIIKGIENSEDALKLYNEILEDEI